MPSPLEKARQDPESIKGRILASAGRLFGSYGFQGTTTRMIAQDVGIDISTLYYHWGEKQDLYEAVITDLTEQIREKLAEIERTFRGKPVAERISLGIDMICDYLFSNPELSNLVLLRYFSSEKYEQSIDINVAEFISKIAVSIGQAFDKSSISTEAKARIIAVWNSVFNFISGENFFRPMLAVDHDQYVTLVKDTLKFILIPAFGTQTSKSDQGPVL